MQRYDFMSNHVSFSNRFWVSILDNPHRVYRLRHGKSDFGYTEPDFGTTIDAIQTVNTDSDSENVNVYSVNGVQVRRSVNKGNATRGLAKGIYIVGGKKVVVR
jgi:hypothetical protein